MYLRTIKNLKLKLYLWLLQTLRSDLLKSEERNLQKYILGGRNSLKNEEEKRITTNSGKVKQQMSLFLLFSLENLYFVENYCLEKPSLYHCNVIKLFSLRCRIFELQ